MAAQYRQMDESLRRTSERAREVLERARRREVDWWAAHRHGGTRPGTQGAENDDDESSVTLEEAFTTMSDFMRHTTEQCKVYHSCLLPGGITEQEKQHVGQFHRRRFPHEAQRPESHLVSPSAPLPQPGMKMADPRDVYIEVAPGTYRISAGSPTSQAQTRIVTITPGQSVDLAFHV